MSQYIKIHKNWRVKKQSDETAIQNLRKILNINPILCNLLLQRGIDQYETAKNFFRPSLENLYDPFLMKDMDKAVERLKKAFDNNEKILIYGDYDVDGTTSVALLYLFINEYISISKTISIIDYYVPDRYDEGYGVSIKGIDFAKENGFTLIITVDCGIRAIDKVEYATLQDIDFIICDHHLSGDNIPAAVAVLDPKRRDCNYPFNNLSGCGVAFKFLQAFCQQYSIDEYRLFKHLDLVAVSIASDIVPIVDENRILAYYGLKQLNEKPGLGLASIINIAAIKEKQIEIEDIVFKIGPRINAAGRIKSARTSVDLLISGDKQIAAEVGQEVNVYNIERKQIDKEITEEALSLINNDNVLSNAKSTVIYKDDWHKGVIGIVASRLIDYYYRPTIVLTQSNGIATGSGRSIEGFDLYEAIDSCGDLLDKYGGHTHAAGLSLKIENIPMFQQRFEAFVSSNISPEISTPYIEIDAEISITDINEKFFGILEQFRPYGPENMAPIFCIRNVTDRGTAKLIGADKSHLRMDLFHPDDLHQSIAVIGFGFGYMIDKIKSEPSFDICFTIDRNEFNGVKKLQLMIRDITFNTPKND